MIHHRNNFVRRFPHHPILLKHKKDLGQVSYYLAGIKSDKIYVANSIAPLSITVLDTSFQSVEVFRISLPRNTIKFTSVRISVRDSLFYLADGTEL